MGDATRREGRLLTKRRYEKYEKRESLTYSMRERERRWLRGCEKREPDGKYENAVG